MINLKTTNFKSLSDNDISQGVYEMNGEGDEMYKFDSRGINRGL